MEQTHAQMGKNRTGIATSPKLTTAMLEGQGEFPPDVAGDEGTIAAFRIATTKDAPEPIGSVPLPTTLKGAVKTGMTAVKGESPSQLVDKLGGRLAFERTGVRLYEALIAKFDATGSFDGGPSRADLESIMEQEYQHFTSLREAIEKLGGDPTVMTPSADLEATLAQGPMQLLVEPRTNLAQCLEAALALELRDNDSWEALCSIAGQAGQDMLVTRFEQALAEEKQHLVNVRRWLSAAQGIAQAAE